MVFNPQTIYVLERVEGEVNELGQITHSFEPVSSFEGFVDLVTGSDLDPKRNDFLVGSTHIVITFDTDIQVSNFDRLQVNDLTLEITKVDDPMCTGDHLEIYCQAVDAHEGEL